MNPVYWDPNSRACIVCGVVVTDPMRATHEFWHENRIATVSSLSTAVTSLQTQIADSVRFLATGTVAVPTLLLGATSVLNVPLSRPMDSDQYAVDLLVPGALIGRVSATVAARTTSAVTLSVTAGLAVSAGSSLHVIAWE